MTFKGFSIACLMAVGLAGCNYQAVPDPTVSAQDAKYLAMVPNFEIPTDFRRYQVEDPTGEAPGTVLIDTRRRDGLGSAGLDRRRADRPQGRMAALDAPGRHA